MSETLQRNYQSPQDMDQPAPALRRNFYVFSSGRTNGAHLPFVGDLNAGGQTEVFAPEESDYLVVFCPIASRVGTDISEALEIMPRGKPAILVVMHHTFNPDQVVAESRRQVDHPDVVLVVDCLFFEGKLLTCNRNDIARDEVQKFLGIRPQVSTWTDYISGMIRTYWPVVAAGCCILVTVAVVAAVLVTELE